MSTRLTTEWTERLVDALGESGAKGEEGELTVIEILKATFPFDKVEWNPSNKNKQLDGHDITMTIDGEEFPIDVKANLHTGFQSVIVDEKIHKSKAKYWVHINSKDSNDLIMYSVSTMLQFIEDNNIGKRSCGKGGGLGYYIDRDSVPQT